MEEFQLFGQPFNVLEILGVISGVAGVWLTIRQNILCFPVGIINVGIYSFIFFHSRLFANAFLQLVYTVLLIYGWIQWNNKTTEDGQAITTSGKRLSLILFAIGIITSFSLGYIMQRTTEAPLPYWDAATTAMSLIAQWMIAKKKLENWLLWIAADIIYVGMYIHQSLYLTAVLYFIFLILAVKGYIEWKKALSQPTLNA